MSNRFQDNIIENFKTIIIPLNFGNNITQVSYTIQNIEFEPQELILNAISFVDDSVTLANTSPLLLVTSNLPLNTNQLCCAPGGGTNGALKLDSYFQLTTKKIGGTYNFYLSNANVKTRFYMFNPRYIYYVLLGRALSNFQKNTRYRECFID